MKRPIIGLTPSFVEDGVALRLYRRYLDCVYQAGGYPVILSPYDEGAEEMDGFVFTGGVDIDPAHYGEDALPLCKIDLPRDDFEIRLFRRVRHKPMLGICRGMQVLNVLLGGTLYQDIPAQYETHLHHAQTEPHDMPTHEVFLEPPLSAMLGRERVSVNSLHHQAVKDLAPGVLCGARAEDGLVEAIIAPNEKFLVGVQWHPESRDFEGTGKRLFAEFVESCKQ